MKRSTYLFIAMALLLSLALSACAVPTPQVVEKVVEKEVVVTATPEPTGPCPDNIVFCWTPPDITGVFRTATDYFNKSALDSRTAGINVSLVSQAPTSHIAFADQVAIIEDFVARKCDVIAISPIEVEVVKPAIKKANEAGIPVIIVNLLEPIEGVEVASYIGFDNTQAARISGFALVDYFGGPGVLGTGRTIEVAEGTYLDLAWWEEVYKTITDEEKAAVKAKVAIIEGVAGGFFSQARLNGFHSVVDEYAGIEVIGAPCAADWNREKGIKCAEDFLTANPDLDAIWAASNEMGLGAMLAAEGAGRLEVAGQGPVLGDDKVAVFTNDVTPESADRVAEGKMIAETTHGFPDWGWYGTEFGVTMACGGKVPQIFDIRPRTMYQANARLFYPNPALEPIDWATIAAGGSPRVQ